MHFNNAHNFTITVDLKNGVFMKKIKSIIYL